MRSNRLQATSLHGVSVQTAMKSFPTDHGDSLLIASLIVVHLCFDSFPTMQPKHGLRNQSVPSCSKPCVGTRSQNMWVLPCFLSLFSQCTNLPAVLVLPGQVKKASCLLFLPCRMLSLEVCSAHRHPHFSSVLKYSLGQSWSPPRFSQ